MKFTETANRLKNALNRSNMTARELSIKSGVSESSISQYITGTHKPGNISAGKMAAVLHINPIWLMGFDADPEDISSISTPSPTKYSKVPSLVDIQPVPSYVPESIIKDKPGNGKARSAVPYYAALFALLQKEQIMRLLIAASEADPDQIEMAINLLNYKKEK